MRVNLGVEHPLTGEHPVAWGDPIFPGDADQPIKNADQPDRVR